MSEKSRSRSSSSSSSSSSNSSSSSGNDDSHSNTSEGEAYSSDDQRETRFKVQSIVTKAESLPRSSSKRRSSSPDEQKAFKKASDEKNSDSGKDCDSDREHAENVKSDNNYKNKHDKSSKNSRVKDDKRNPDRENDSDVEKRRRDRNRLDERNTHDNQGDTSSRRERDRYEGRRKDRYDQEYRERSPDRVSYRGAGPYNDRNRQSRGQYDQRDSRRGRNRGREDREESRYDRDLAAYRSYQNERQSKQKRERPRREDREEEVRENGDRDQRSSTERKRKPIDDAGLAEGNLAAEAPPAKKSKPEDELVTTKTGGAYIPPAKLRMMQQQITDKNSAAYQRLAWEALKKSINGLINKVNVSNLINIVQELFHENLVRGRGLLARSIIQAQAASLTFTHVYGALTAIINTKFPQNGELILKRLILNFRKGYKRNDKAQCLAATRFIAHLVNQQVAHEVLALEILTLLLENTTDDSVEVAIAFLKECGQKLTEVSPRGVHAIYERLRSILHEGQIDKRVQYMIEVIFTIRKDGFKDHPSVMEELDKVEEEDQFTHLVTLDEVTDPETMLDVFRVDPEYEENEEKYKVLRKEILDEGSSDEESGSGSGSDSDSSDDEEEAEDGDEEGKQKILDQTETNLVALRRIIYLTIQSSLDFEECAHKLLKMELKPGQEVELCNMILDCCAQQRTYEKFFGLLAQRFCQLDKKYVVPFEAMFQEQYETIHRLETNKLRNVGKMFAHLLHTDAVSWGVLQIIRLNEEDTTSSSRIFIKILFQELSEYMGLPKLNTRLKDETLQVYFEGLFPRDNPRNCRFAINFFTSIGLGGLTDELRAHLKSMPKQAPAAAVPPAEESSSDSSSSSDSDDSSSDSSDSSSDSESSSSESEEEESSKENRASKKTSENGPTKEQNSRNSDKMNSRRSEKSDDRTPSFRSEKSDRRNQVRSERTHLRSENSDKTERMDRSERNFSRSDRDRDISNNHNSDEQEGNHHRYSANRKNRDRNSELDGSERASSQKRRDERENSSYRRREEREQRHRRR